MKRTTGYSATTFAAGSANDNDEGQNNNGIKCCEYRICQMAILFCVCVGVGVP